METAIPTSPKKDAAAHTLEGKLTFEPGDPPHGQVEFPLDPTAGEGNKDKLPLDFFKPVRKPEPGAKDPMKKDAMTK